MKIGSNVKKAYKNLYVIKWSFWFALATCGNFQIGNYIQSLWKDIDGKLTKWKKMNRIFFFLFIDDKEAYNGAVEAATTLTGALVVFLIGFVNVDWKVWGNLAIVLMTGFTSILLYIMGITHNIWMAYSGITLCILT